MIKLMHVSDYHIKPYSVKPWHLSEKCSTYIGKGCGYSVSQKVAVNYNPPFINGRYTKFGDTYVKESFDNSFSRIIEIENETTLLFPCVEEEDEKLLFLTFETERDFGKQCNNIKIVGGDIISFCKGINHTIETYHLIIRLAFDTSFAYVKTNNGVKIFSWEEYITLSENDFDPWFEIVSTINYVYKTKKNRAEPKK